MQKHKSGFTLIELLVVIAIIGILSAIGLVSLGTAREKARDSKRQNDLASVRTALALYFDDSNSYPPNDSQCNIGAGSTCSWTSNFGTLMTGGTTPYIGALPVPAAGGTNQQRI